MPLSNSQIAIVISELIALYLIWRLWKSNDHPFFKVALSLIALIPFLGPFIVLWTANFPSKIPPALRDQRWYYTDVADRWRDVMNEKNASAKFAKWKRVMKETEHDKTLL
jgi:hypothetical protein